MGSQATGASYEADILARLLQPDTNDLRPEVAEYILSLSFRPSDVERMSALTEKAAAAALTADEAGEIAGYRHVAHLLALLQSKARLAQKRSRAQ